MFKEDLLHLIWRLRKFDFLDLKTIGGVPINIIEFGQYNYNSGPDFLNAKIKIGNTLWLGHVEIHINSSDWNAHKHQHDDAFNNVILHVVYKHNKDIKNKNGYPLPTLELQSRFSIDIIENYESLKSSANSIPCASLCNSFKEEKYQFFLERLVVERVERKTRHLDKILKSNMMDWEDLLYKMLMKYFGLKVNADAFEHLAHIAPYKITKQLHHYLFQLEAFLFGQAGMLEQTQDDFQKKLSKEYQHLKNKYSLLHMPQVEWRFSRMRPANFPTVRLAQITAVYCHTPALFQEIINSKSIKDIKTLLTKAPSSYWNNHYVFGKTSSYKVKKIGETTINSIIINVIIPIIFKYGTILNNEALKEKALDYLYALTSENNKIIRMWHKLGFKSKNAAQSQALIELKSSYCDQYRCLNCNIGQSLLFK